MTPLEMIKAAARAPRLDADTERSLAILAHVGDTTAAQQIVRSNLSWVVSTAYRHKRRGLDDATFDDLVSEGTEGLYHALDKFDPYLGNRFSTYALPWVRVKMQRVLMLVSSDAAVCVPLELDRATCSEHGETMEQGRGNQRLDYIEDDSPSPEDAALDAQRSAAVRQTVHELRSCLKPCDHDLIQNRLSVDVLDRDSLEAIGKRHSVTREGVRQRELRLKKLLRQSLPRSLRS